LQIALAPWHPAPYQERSHAHREAGEHEQAIHDLDAALLWAGSQPPYQSHLYRLRSVSWRRLDRVDQAVADLEKAVALDPSNASACGDLARLLVTGPAPCRDHAKAVPLAEEAARKTAEPDHLVTLAIAYYRVGRYADALDVCRAIDPLWPRRPLDLYVAAMCCHRLGSPEKAGEFYDRTVRWQEGFKGKQDSAERQEFDAFRAETEEVLGVAARSKKPD
jgi:tetratricopeptide (TPR) repeat protein